MASIRVRSACSRCSRPWRSLAAATTPTARARSARTSPRWRSSATVSATSARTRSARSRQSGGGRFSTNPAKFWVEYVADYYGVTVSKNRVGGFGVPITVLGGTGYAEGGARVALQPGINCAPDGAGGCTLAGALTRPVTQQIAAHLAASGGTLSNRQLALILAGNNDMLIQAAGVRRGRDAARSPRRRPRWASPARRSARRRVR